MKPNALPPKRELALQSNGLYVLREKDVKGAWIQCDIIMENKQ